MYLPDFLQICVAVGALCTALYSIVDAYREARADEKMLRDLRERAPFEPSEKPIPLDASSNYHTFNVRDVVARIQDQRDEHEGG